MWENNSLRIIAQKKANFPANYGGHFVVEQDLGVKTPYDDYFLFARMAVAAAVVQKGLEKLGLAPHANIQSNANWAFRREDGDLKDTEQGRSQRCLHIHIYGRHPDDPNWADPVRPATYWEQQAGKYWHKVFPEEKLEKLSCFIEKEIPIFHP